MKKYFLAAWCLLFTTLCFAQKFGYTNSNILLRDIPEVKAADSDLNAFQTQLTKRGQEMVKNLQEKAAELKRKQDQGTISPKDVETQTAKLEEEQAKIAEYEQEVYKKLSLKREELFSPILERVNKAMEEVAKENNYVYVFDNSTQMLLYADEALDVTGLVKAKLGISK